MENLRQKIYKEKSESWDSLLAYKIFLLERELGYKIDGNTNGLLLMERLKMLTRYYMDKEKEYEKNKSKDKNNKLIK